MKIEIEHILMSISAELKALISLLEKRRIVTSKEVEDLSVELIKIGLKEQEEKNKLKKTQK